MTFIPTTAEQERFWSLIDSAGAAAVKQDSEFCAWLDPASHKYWPEGAAAFAAMAHVDLLLDVPPISDEALAHLSRRIVAQAIIHSAEKPRLFSFWVQWPARLWAGAICASLAAGLWFGGTLEPQSSGQTTSPVVVAVEQGNETFALAWSADDWLAQ